ncbi:MAG TPA: shikimate dehydrogenase [Syntrophomonas sp.]|nr:shikimate dehydrogenase [Syntrophomonas sp.]
MEKKTVTLLGLFGNPIGHSLSPLMQNSAIQLLDLPYTYLPFEIAPASLQEAVAAVRALSMGGVNVTIPFKEAVIPFLDELSADARACGAVNLIRNQGGTLTGMNTDGKGFIRSLEEEGVATGGRFVFIGAGGAARALAWSLTGFPAEHFDFLDIDLERARHMADWIHAVSGCSSQGAVMNPENFKAVSVSADFIINCSAVGMYPHTEGCPVDSLDQVKDSVVVYDLVYNPLQTRLMKMASARGLKTIGGLSMLVHQGALSLEILTGCAAPVSYMKEVVADYFTQ